MGLQVLGIRSAHRRFSLMALRARDLRPVWLAVGDDVASAMAAQFDTHGAAGGRAWAPLKPEYLRWKIAHGYSPETLIKTGAMERSLTDRPMSVERHFPKSAEFGSNDPKLKYHQYGTVHMPQREVVYWFEPLTTRVADRVGRYIFDGKV